MLQAECIFLVDKVDVNFCIGEYERKLIDVKTTQEKN